MKILKRLLCVAMAVVMAFTALSVTAFADEYSKAKFIDSGIKTSFALKAKNGARESDAKIFKVELSKKGSLKLEVNSPHFHTYIQVLNEDRSEIFEYTKEKEISGTNIYHITEETRFVRDNKLERAKGSVEYELKKGVYYVKVWVDDDYQGSNKISLSFSYPQDKSKSAEITSFTISLNKGDSLQLGTILNGEGDVTWSTSKKSVATVTGKGKITAKGKGSAVITAKSGSSIRKITIKVS